jgi:hypothetical protein
VEVVPLNVLDREGVCGFSADGHTGGSDVHPERTQRHETNNIAKRLDMGFLHKE